MSGFSFDPATLAQFADPGIMMMLPNPDPGFAAGAPFLPQPPVNPITTLDYLTPEEKARGGYSATLPGEQDFRPFLDILGMKQAGSAASPQKQAAPLTTEQMKLLGGMMPQPQRPQFIGGAGAPGMRGITGSLVPQMPQPFSPQQLPHLMSLAAILRGAQ